MKKLIIGLLFCISLISICIPVSAAPSTDGAIVNNTQIAWNNLPAYFNVTINESYGDTMFINWSTNMSGVWTVVGTNVSVTNGSYRLYTLGWVLANFTACNKTFYWTANVSNSTYRSGAATWSNITRNFTLACNTTLVTISANLNMPNTFNTATSVFAIIGIVIIISVIMSIIFVVQKYKG